MIYHRLSSQKALLKIGWNGFLRKYLPKLEIRLGCWLLRINHFLMLILNHYETFFRTLEEFITISASCDALHIKRLLSFLHDISRRTDNCSCIVFRVSYSWFHPNSSHFFFFLICFVLKIQFFFHFRVMWILNSQLVLRF